METAKAILTFGKWTRRLMAIVFSPVKTTLNEVTPGAGGTDLCCPHCDRCYGSAVSYPVLLKEYCLVKCTCGKKHIGYKPFNGFH